MKSPLQQCAIQGSPESLDHILLKIRQVVILYSRRDGIVVRVSVSQSVGLRFIFQIESYQKTLKNGIHTSPAWRSAKGIVRRTSDKLACCVLWKGT